MRQMDEAIKRSDCEVLVLGAGLAGLSLAIGLQKRGVRTLVARQQRPPLNRWESLPPEIFSVLVQLGVWEPFLGLPADQRRECPGIRSVWGAEEILDTDYFFHPIGKGWHVDRQSFHSLVEGRADVLGTAWVDLDRLVQAEYRSTDGMWSVVLRKQDGLQELTARFVVDASGRGARLARMQGARRVANERQVTLLTEAEFCPDFADDWLWMESSPFGWWYHVRTGASSAMIGFVTDVDILPTHGVARRRFLRADRLQRLLCHDRTTSADFRSVVTCDASCGRLTPSAGAGWMAIGDAALSADPLSGQGVVMACQEGLTAAHIIFDALEGRRQSHQKGQAALESQRTRYLEVRQSVYDEEARWPEGAFWKRRRRVSGGL